MYKYGFEVTVSFIYGFEEESEEDFVKTLQLIESLYCHNISKVQLHKFMPLPSTEETLKVSDKLHKDLSDIDISIYQSSRFNDKVQNIIFKNKEENDYEQAEKSSGNGFLAWQWFLTCAMVTPVQAAEN